MAEPMKIRATMQGDVADVKVLMNHPMETGLRKDAKTGQLVPAHYISTVTAKLNGTVVLEGNMAGGVSKNPYLGFKVKGAKSGDTIEISWEDNKGDKRTDTAKIS
ncbi:MAG: thiosulfate oxidation carrier complex protein SoxZ [Pseudomonadota bacterium]